METHTRCLVLPSTYRDSVWLMHLSHTLEGLPGVQRVAVMMGTPHNKAVLQQAGLLTAEGEGGKADDVLVCVQAETPTAASGVTRGDRTSDTAASAGRCSAGGGTTHTRDGPTPSTGGESRLHFRTGGVRRARGTQGVAPRFACVSLQ